VVASDFSFLTFSFVPLSCSVVACVLAPARSIRPLAPVVRDLPLCTEVERGRSRTRGRRRRERERAATRSVERERRRTAPARARLTAGQREPTDCPASCHSAQSGRGVRPAGK